VNSPGGVISAPEYRNSVPGNRIATQSATDVAITGLGFFAIADTPTATTTSYSRRGDYPAGTVVGHTTNGTLPTLSASSIGTAITLSLTNPVTTTNGPFGMGTNPLTLNLGGLGQASGMTQYSDSGKQLSVQTLDKDGHRAGEFRDLRIDEDGCIIADDSNGEKRHLFQVPLAKFPAPDQLQRLDGGSFAVTQESGLPILITPGRIGLGTLTANSLEGSNVDIADAFSKMIVNLKR